VNHRIPKVDNGAEIELHWNYRYRTGREAKSLSLVESGYLIVREIKHSGTARQIETLGANRSLPAQGSEAKMRRVARKNVSRRGRCAIAASSGGPLSTVFGVSVIWRATRPGRCGIPR